MILALVARRFGCVFRSQNPGFRQVGPEGLSGQRVAVGDAGRPSAAAGDWRGGSASTGSASWPRLPASGAGVQAVHSGTLGAPSSCGGRQRTIIRADSNAAFSDRPGNRRCHPALQCWRLPPGGSPAWAAGKLGWKGAQWTGRRPAPTTETEAEARAEEARLVDALILGSEGSRMGSSRG